MAESTAKAKALALLGKRDYSREELARKLTEKGFDAAQAGEAVDRLAELGLINDESYAGMIVRHYAAKGFGAARIRQELGRRYVPRELWDAALEELPEQDGTVDALLRARLGGGEPDRNELRRASEALLRRGFSWEQIKEAVERFRREGCDI